MQPPIKPWENGSLNRLPPHNNSGGRSSMTPSGSPFLRSSLPNIPGRTGTALGRAASNQQQSPPLPPSRASVNPNANQNSLLRSRLAGHPVYGMVSPYGGGLAGSYGSYGGYGGYGSYGGYGGLGSYGMAGYGGLGSMGGYSMNRYGAPNPNDPESRFIQLAEESSRPAFQSIESLVQAFHSVSMMLDSTFNAVYTSFRAVLGVAENFGRLRSLLGQFFSSVALFRAFLWLYKKVLYLLGLRRENPNQDQLWQAAVQAAGEDIATSTGRPRSSWPILMFMGIVFSGPYLIFKLMSSLSNAVDVNETVPRMVSWDPEQAPGSTAVALYGFMARSEDELSFYPGQRITIAPLNFQRKDLQGWLLAKVEGSPEIGLVPFNYLAAASQTNAAFVPEVTMEKISSNTNNVPTLVPETLPSPSVSEQKQDAMDVLKDKLESIPKDSVKAET